MQPRGPVSLLARISEFDVVEVFNPMSKDFTATVAHSVVDNNPPPAQGEEHLRRVYGISMDSKKPALRHVKQQITIQSGKSLRMMGDAARVVVMQLIKKMMIFEGKKKQMADPGLRLEYENRVIMNSEKYAANEPIKSVEERLAKQLEELNRPEGVKEADEVEHEQAFPTVTRGATEGGQGGTERSSGNPDSPQDGAGAPDEPAFGAKAQGEDTGRDSGEPADSPSRGAKVGGRGTGKAGVEAKIKDDVAGV